MVEKLTKILCYGFNQIAKIAPSEYSYIDKQRLSAIYFYTGTLVLGLILGLVGLMGPEAPFFDKLNSVYFASIIGLFAAYCFKKLRVETALMLMMYVTHLSTSIEIVYCTYHFSVLYYKLLIVGNMVILAINTSFALIVRKKKTLQVLSAWSMLIFLFPTVVTGDKSLLSFCFIFLLAFTFISILGAGLIMGMEKMQRENISLKGDEEELMRILRLNRQEVKAFILLAKKKNDENVSRRLLDMMGDRAKKNLVDNVAEFLRHRDQAKDDVERAFPELTPSERAIARLILQGKQQNEIAMLLDKTVINVNTQRAHIRKKLGLATSDNLLEVLQKRMEKDQ